MRRPLSPGERWWPEAGRGAEVLAIRSQRDAVTDGQRGLGEDSGE